MKTLKERAGYDGKSQQWQYGFDLACNEMQAELDALKNVALETLERLGITNEFGPVNSLRFWLDNPNEIDALKAAQTWISVKDQMPPNDEPVLVNCSNSPYKPPYQTTVASYINAGSMHIHSDEASADWCDYDDESGEYTAQEGWYEQVGLSNPECGCMQMSFNVTHWTPLPPAPETAK